MRAMIVFVSTLRVVPRPCAVARARSVPVLRPAVRRPAGTRRRGRERHAAGVCLRAGPLRADLSSDYVIEQTASAHEVRKSGQTPAFQAL